jgi:hypothetical protein
MRDLHFPRGLGNFFLRTISDLYCLTHSRSSCCRFPSNACHGTPVQGNPCNPSGCGTLLVGFRECTVASCLTTWMTEGWPAVPRLALHGGKVSFFFRISGVQCRVIVAKQITQNPVRGSRNEYQWNLRERQAPPPGALPRLFHIWLDAAGPLISAPDGPTGVGLWSSLCSGT